MMGHMDGDLGELGGLDNPVFKALNTEQDLVHIEGKIVNDEQAYKVSKKYHDRFNPYIKGHGAAERTTEDPDTGEIYYDM